MSRGVIAILSALALSALALPVGACGITTPHPSPLGDCEAGQPCNNQPGGGIVPTPTEGGVNEAGTDAAADAVADAAPLDAATD